MALALPESTLPVTTGSYWEYRASLFIVMCGGRMRGNRHRVLMGFKEKFLPHEDSKAVGQVAQKWCTDSIFRFFQDTTDKTLRNLSSALTLFLAGCWSRDLLRLLASVVVVVWTSLFLRTSTSHEVRKYCGPGKQEHTWFCLVWSQILWKQSTWLCRKQSLGVWQKHTGEIKESA